MNYAPYEKNNDMYVEYTSIKKDVKKKLDQNLDNNCMYKKRENNVPHLNRCEETQSIKEGNHIIDTTVLEKNKCKLKFEDRMNQNIISHKKNKQLNKRIINTIPYKNKSNFDYNPELEIIVKSGLHTADRKSVSNTSESKSDMQPMTNYVKNKIDDKNSKYDVSRFGLSSRNLKGNEIYLTEYKKKLDLLKNSLNNN